MVFHTLEPLLGALPRRENPTNLGLSMPGLASIVERRGVDDVDPSRLPHPRKSDASREPRVVCCCPSVILSLRSFTLILR